MKTKVGYKVFSVKIINGKSKIRHNDNCNKIFPFTLLLMLQQTFKTSSSESEKAGFKKTVSLKQFSNQKLQI